MHKIGNARNGNQSLLELFVVSLFFFILSVGIIAVGFPSIVRAESDEEVVLQGNGTAGGHLKFMPETGVSYSNGQYIIDGTSVDHYTISNADSVYSDKITISDKATNDMTLTLDNLSIDNKDSSTYKSGYGLGNLSHQTLNIITSGQNSITGAYIGIYSKGSTTFGGDGQLNLLGTKSDGIFVESYWSADGSGNGTYHYMDIMMNSGVVYAKGGAKGAWANGTFYINGGEFHGISTTFGQKGCGGIYCNAFSMTGGTCFATANKCWAIIADGARAGITYPSGYTALGMDGDGNYSVVSKLTGGQSQDYRFVDNNGHEITDLRIGPKGSTEDEGLIHYQTQVQNDGWQEVVSDGATAGTHGRSLRLEGIKLSLGNKVTGGVSYQTHVQNVGWQGWKSNGELSGTEGQSLRLEAIQIQLTGEAADTYDVYYRVHAQNIGWMGWAKNGEYAGTAGYAYRLEAIQIQLIKKGGAAPNASDSDTSDVYRHPFVQYQTHVQNVGWQGFVNDGAMSGTEGRSLRLEGIKIALSNQDYSGDIQYKTHVQNIGWQEWASNGTMSGTEGRGLRLEAIQIQLNGEMANQYDVYYRVHCQNIGWMGWAKNGASAGTEGYAYRLEGIQIQLVKKGGAAPGSTENAFRKLDRAGIMEAYREIVKANQYSYNPMEKGNDENFYYLFDVDSDSVPELILKKGAFEPNYTDYFYTYRDGQVVNIGQFVGTRQYEYYGQSSKTSGTLLSVQAPQWKITGAKHLYIANGSLQIDDIINKYQQFGIVTPQVPIPYYATPYAVHRYLATDLSGLQ